jgi:hypothetical protein
MRSIRLFLLAIAFTTACASPQYASADPSKPPAQTPARPPSSPPGRPKTTPPAQPPAVVAAASVAGRDFPDVPEKLRPSVLCGDGADMIVAAGEQKIYRMTRSHQVTQSRGPRRPSMCQVRGTGTSALIAVVGDTGEYARYNGTDWEYGLAPALDGEDLSGAVLASANRTTFAGRQRALYTRDSDTWTVQRYPSGGIDVVYAGVDASNTIYLVGAHGRIVAYSAGAFRDLNVTGIPADVLSSTWVGGWYSLRNNALWVFAQRSVVKIELATLRATVQKVPLFFEVAGAVGTSTPRGDLFTLMTFGDGALYDGTVFSKVELKDHRDNAMYLDPVRAVLFGAGWDAMVRAPVKHPYLGTGQGESLKDP